MAWTFLGSQRSRYWGRAAWISGGLVAICLGLPPYHEKIGADWISHYPDPKPPVALLVFGCIGVVSGITTIASRRRPLILVRPDIVGDDCLPHRLPKILGNVAIPETAYGKRKITEKVSLRQQGWRLGSACGLVAGPLASLIAVIASASENPPAKKSRSPFRVSRRWVRRLGRLRKNQEAFKGNEPFAPICCEICVICGSLLAAGTSRRRCPFNRWHDSFTEIQAANVSKGTDPTQPFRLNCRSSSSRVKTRAVGRPCGQ